MVVFIRVCAKGLKILNSCLSEYFGQLLLSIWQWAIPGKDERPNRGGGGGGGVDDMEFTGVLKKWQVDFPRVNYKRHGISKGDPEKIVWIFHRPWF